MAWIEIHQALPTHRKTLALADELNIEPVQAIGHLTCLWLWALDNAPDGNLADVSVRTLARAALWRKEPQAFADALVVAGLMDGDQTIHDWKDYAGRLIERREKDAKRKRDERNGGPDTPPDAPQPSNGHPQDIHKTSDASRVRVNRTVPNRTQPEQNLTGEDPPGGPPATNGHVRLIPQIVSKSVAVIDAFRTLQLELVLTDRDHKAIKNTNASPGMIAEVYAAVARSEYGDAFMRRQLSVNKAIEWINGYSEWKRSSSSREIVDEPASQRCPCGNLAFSPDLGETCRQCQKNGLFTAAAVAAARQHRIERTPAARGA